MSSHSVCAVVYRWAFKGCPIQSAFCSQTPSCKWWTPVSPPSELSQAVYTVYSTTRKWMWFRSFYCTMMEKKKSLKGKKKNWVPFSLYLCLYQSLALGTVDVYPYLSSLSLLLMKELEKKKVEPFSLEQDVVNSNVISLSVCFTFISYTSRSSVKRSGLWVQTDPGPTCSPSLHMRPAVPVCHVKQWGPGARSVWLSVESAGPEDAQ